MEVQPNTSENSKTDLAPCGRVRVPEERAGEASGEGAVWHSYNEGSSM